MHYTDKKSVKKTSRRWMLVIPVLLLVSAGTLFGLEKSHVINLYTRKTSSVVPTTTTESKPINQVDYSPATPTDNEDINKQKESGQIDTNPTTPDTLSVTLTSSAKVDSGPLDVRAIIAPLINSGTCTLTLTKSGATSIIKTANVAPQNTYSTCESLVVNPDEFSQAGNWDLSLIVTGPNNLRGSAKDTAEITK